MKIPKNLVQVLKKEKKVLISYHINPDGDAIGSALALSDALDAIGKETVIYSKDPVPDFYRFLPGCRRVLSRENVLKDNPFLVLLDCNSPERAALEDYSFSSSVVIDHHETERQFGDIRWIDRSAAATGMMVFHLIKALRVSITKEIATNLYAAIAVDTGTFRYSNTTPDVLRAGAELIEKGAEPHIISDSLYEAWDRKRFKLLALTLNTLRIENGIALTHVTRDMLKKTGAKTEDTENFSNFPRMIDSVRISAMFREVGTKLWKVSLRSKGNVNVARIAECYGGGGHKNAAGFRIKSDLETAKASLLKTSLQRKSKGRQ